MVRVCLAEIEVHENEDVNIGELGMVQNIGRDKVEIGGVEFEFSVKFFAHVAIVAEFVYEGWTVVVALELS